MIIAIVIGVSCLFWIIAAILFVCAKGVDRRISESKKDCVEKTTATVVDVEEVYKRNVDTYNYTWYPAYEFYVNGERVVQKSVIGTRLRLLPQCCKCHICHFCFAMPLINEVRSYRLTLHRDVRMPMHRQKYYNL